MFITRPFFLWAFAVLFLAVCLPIVGQPEELPADNGRYLTRDELTKKYDKDGDGQLSPAERRTMIRDIVEGRVDVPPRVRENFRKQKERLDQRPGDGPAKPAATNQDQLPKMQIPENVIVERDVVYGNAGNRPLKLDLVLPKEKSDSPRPLIVFIHGGGWFSGNKSVDVRRVLPFVASGNYVGASVDYRLSGEAVWPAQIHDCKAAIRWLRANAKKYNIDPERIGVWGSSSGGHLANMLGTSGGVKELEGNCGTPDQSSRVSCVVDFCGPTNLLAAKWFKIRKRLSVVDLLLGSKIEEKQDLAKQASPITYVSKDDPPFLIVHGTADNTVPFEQAEMFDKALRKANVSVTFVKIIGGKHGIGEPEAQERVQAFFEKHLRGQNVEVSSEPIQATTPRSRP